MIWDTIKIVKYHVFIIAFQSERYIGYWGGNCCCMNCDILFGRWNRGKGILEIGELKKECCVCLEEKRLVSLPKCIHEVCIECLRKIYFCGFEGTSGMCPLCRKK